VTVSETTDESKSELSSCELFTAMFAFGFDSLFLSFEQSTFQCPSSLQKAH